jgi:hypothetical protein
MIVSDTNLFLVKDCFGSYKEFTAGRVNTPHYSGRPIDFDAQLTASSEPIKARKITREDGIFRMVQMSVLHWVFS